MEDNRASLPAFYRRFIEDSYPHWVLPEIDRIGAIHDRELKDFPTRWRSANARMMERLRESGIPLFIRAFIRAGLTLYWRSPKFIRSIYWRLIPPNKSRQ